MDRRRVGGNDDGAVTIGIRPEFISFEETGDTVSIDCNIEVVEHLGADTILELATAGQTLTAKIARNDSVNFGDSVRMWVDPARILAFEPDTGKRIRV